jgi:hypothetical protein
VVVGFDLGRLLAGGEAIVRLVPEGGCVGRAQFRIEGDILDGIYLYSASGGVASEFAVVGGWVPEVIEVFPVVWRGLGIVV